MANECFHPRSYLGRVRERALFSVTAGAYWHGGLANHVHGERLCAFLVLAQESGDAAYMPHRLSAARAPAVFRTDTHLRQEAAVQQPRLVHAVASESWERL